MEGRIVHDVCGGSHNLSPLTSQPAWVSSVMAEWSTSDDRHPARLRFDDGNSEALAEGRVEQDVERLVQVGHRLLRKAEVEHRQRREADVRDVVVDGQGKGVGEHVEVDSTLPCSRVGVYVQPGVVVLGSELGERIEGL